MQVACLGDAGYERKDRETALQDDEKLWKEEKGRSGLMLQVEELHLWSCVEILREEKGEAYWGSKIQGQFSSSINFNCCGCMEAPNGCIAKSDPQRTEMPLGMGSAPPFSLK